MQETSMVDAIGTSHQNDFDAITLLHLSIQMQETTMADANSNSCIGHNKPMRQGYCIEISCIGSHQTQN
jgi:hypothetical protein